MFIALWDVSFAQAQSASEKTTEIINSFSAVFNGILSGVTLLLWMLTYLVSLFLNPAWINGSFFGLGEHFREIWILISNVVYFIFAFLLIWIAFMNIIGKQWDKYQLKQALPKFIIWVLIVPFSWFFVQFILSLSAILTISSLTLPSDTFTQYESWLEKIEVYKICTINLNSSSWSTNEVDSSTKTKWFIYCPKENNKTTLKEVLGTWDSSTSIFGLVYTYTYAIMNLDQIDDLTTGDIFKGITTIWDLMVKIVFDLLFVLVYAILMIALGLVLAVRWIYLWLYIMFSPIFWLMYFFGKSGWGEGFFTKFNLKEFFALAMVPVYTMLALSFGLLFLYVVGQWMSTWSNESQSALSQQGVSISEKEINIWWKENGFTLIVEWVIGGSTSTSWNAGKLFADVANGWLGVVGTLILQLFGIIILWWSIMAALRSSEITKQIVEPIHGFWTQVWGMMAKAPTYAPIFPGGQSMQSMKNVGNAAQSYMTTITNERSQRFLDKHGMFGGWKSSEELRKLEAVIQKANDIPSKVAAMHKIFAAVDWDTKKLYTDSEAQKRLFELTNAMGVTLPSDIKKSTDINSPAMLEKLFAAIESKDPINYGKVISWAEGNDIRIDDIIEEVERRKSWSHIPPDRQMDVDLKISGGFYEWTNIPKRVSFWWYHMSLNKQWTLEGDQSIENLIRSLQGRNLQTVRQEFSEKLIDFDRIFAEIKNNPKFQEAITLWDNEVFDIDHQKIKTS